MTPKKSEPYIAFGIILFYIFIRFVFIRQLDGLGFYASYIFEVFFVTAVLFYYRKRVQLFAKPTKNDFIENAVAIPLGFGVFEFTKVIGVPIPFDFHGAEFLFLLLLFGPILEEFIFRQALWLPAEVLLKKTGLVILFTSLIFSFAHFQAYFFVPPEVRSFVIYQASYTFLIALWWGYRYSLNRRLSVPILLHLTFNLGFSLGFLFK